MGLSIATTIITRDRILGSLDKLPPFSPVLTRLLATLADEDVSFGELAAIIETDAILAGNLLRVVTQFAEGGILRVQLSAQALLIAHDRSAGRSRLFRGLDLRRPIACQPVSDCEQRRAEKDSDKAECDHATKHAEEHQHE